MERINGATREGSLLRRVFTLRTWALSEIPLKGTAVPLLVLGVSRAVLRRRVPALAHPDAPATPLWVIIFMLVEAALFLLASLSVGGAVLETKNRPQGKRLDVFGLAIYLAWWVVMVI